MNVAINSHKLTKKDLVYVEQIVEYIHEMGWTPILQENLHHLFTRHIRTSEPVDSFSSKNDFSSGIDLALSIGGDGTFLKTVSYVQSSGVPVMGINTGRLGFLANTNFSDFQRALEKVKNKDYDFQPRSLLKVETEGNIFGDENFAFNELALHKKDTASMITVHASLDGKYLNSYWADGLIVATPTGSTAYSLSCGGPIITPGCEVHILSPIAPHNLNVRPVVVPDHMPIELTVEGRDRSYLLTLDSQSKVVKNGTKVHLEKADFMINVVKFEENNFLDTIRNKMMWGLDRRN